MCAEKEVLTEKVGVLIHPMPEKQPTIFQTNSGTYENTLQHQSNYLQG